LIVIPTFNEAMNITELVTRIGDVVHRADHIHLLVVDDGSPDHTAAVVRRLTAEDAHWSRNLHLLERPGKLGLGTAYVAGFQWGLAWGADLLAEMDADLSHDPAHLPAMIDACQRFDVVIGSRYVPGGGVHGWGLMRKLISKGGSGYARRVLGVSVQDMTGGYNLWRRSVLTAIDLNRIRSEGYAFQIELKYRAIKNGFRYLEVPIIFRDRTAGRSKISKSIILEAFYRVWQLRGATLRP